MPTGDKQLFETGRNEDSISGLYFDYGYARLDTFGDGSGRVVFNPPRTMAQELATPVLIPSTGDAGYLGAKWQEDYAGLGYPGQDSFTQHFANLEHVALHLWIGQAKKDFYLARPRADKYHVRAVLKSLEEITQGKVTERAIEEGFVTNIQLISNGIQPDEIQRGELETSCTFLGLNNFTAITAALAFVQYFRSAMRKTYAPFAV